MKKRKHSKKSFSSGIILIFEGTSKHGIKTWEGLERFESGILGMGRF
jgi:hypothetical protein